MTNLHRCVTTFGVGRPSSSSGEEWQSFKMLFHGFAVLPSAVDQYTLSPEFTCNGHRWCIKIYPGGSSQGSAEYVSLFLQHCSGGCATATFELSVLDKYQSVKQTQKVTLWSFTSEKKTWDWNDLYLYRPSILNQSNEILDDNGTLAVVVSIKRDSAAPFVPRRL